MYIFVSPIESTGPGMVSSKFVKSPSFARAREYLYHRQEHNKQLRIDKSCCKRINVFLVSSLPRAMCGWGEVVSKSQGT